ncbi:MAG TPA: RHS repeat-associated core domain-containing protein [Bacteroidales bacterium]|nr:RHS repeat-associated core domain-containing protein [Bacteroidales bacterium]
MKYSFIRVYKWTICHRKNPVAFLLADGTNTIHYTYDSNGDLAYMNLNGNLYYYERNAQNDIIGLVDSNMNEVVTYTYDSWGKLLNIGGSLAGTVGKINPFRYRGYYYDTETRLYYLSSRYYDPGVGRFINADDEDTLTATPSNLTDKNLYSYCDNNPIMRSDDDGHFWFALAAPLLALGPVGWVAGGLLIVATFAIAYIAIDHYRYTHRNVTYLSKSDVDPYARPGQKRQGRERKNKARDSDKWKPRSKPKAPKKHTPGKDHRKYKKPKLSR